MAGPAAGTPSGAGVGRLGMRQLGRGKWVGKNGDFGWSGASPRTAAALSTEPSRQEHWRGLPFPSAGIFPTRGSSPRPLGLPHWRVSSLPPGPPGRPLSAALRLLPRAPAHVCSDTRATAPAHVCSDTRATAPAQVCSDTRAPRPRLTSAVTRTPQPLLRPAVTRVHHGPGSRLQ